MTDWRITTSPKPAADAHKTALLRIAAHVAAYGRKICDDWVMTARDAQRLMPGRMS